jgi:hypothetical protein
LGVLSRELCFRATAEFATPSPKSSAGLVIEETRSRFFFADFHFPRGAHTATEIRDAPSVVDNQRIYAALHSTDPREKFRRNFRRERGGRPAEGLLRRLEFDQV